MFGSATGKSMTSVGLESSSGSTQPALVEDGRAVRGRLGEDVLRRPLGGRGDPDGGRQRADPLLGLRVEAPQGANPSTRATCGPSAPEPAASGPSPRPGGGRARRRPRRRWSPCAGRGAPAGRAAARRGPAAGCCDERHHGRDVAHVRGVPALELLLEARAASMARVASSARTSEVPRVAATRRACASASGVTASARRSERARAKVIVGPG